ncbi:TPA: toll/interleukin-1 receptor domain-containing protein, partial [Citrobacter freundii]|nr:toll/interleukin-1 receptor domain-containing protein [Citrobacter freundii]HCE8853916.1 toll/interleukin-1 receptor domain-containing protein [Citrobacter freundii]HCL6634412.1 toll/interleukin-1 receptor domain-containing protein [Citrobacter freundii]HCL6761580.1 toll/interleukin-1 receptor domain-containing protein [Citrobacter freundii]HED2424365.1 toll/interleukin-1 receptor domain-containing protein [Citrobacter freundii]
MKIFLAHAKEDEKITESIYDKLKDNGYTPWMDIRDIPAGVNWDYEIQKNFNNSNVIIIILSDVSCQKNGYIRREMNDAIDKLKYYKPDDIFVIPLLIDNSTVPTFISSKIQYIDYKREDGWELLEKSLALAATQQKIEITKGTTYGDFIFTSITFKEEYNNVPGHEIEITYPIVTNLTKPQSANIISNYFKGRAANLVFNN